MTRLHRRARLRRIEARDQRVDFEDALPGRPVKLALAPLRATLGPVSSDRTVPSRLEAGAGLDGTGTVTVAGTVSIWRPSVDLDVEVSALELPPLDRTCRSTPASTPASAAAGCA